MSILGRKLRRDLRRQPGQFCAVALALALGVAAFVGAYDAYQNLRDSFDSVYNEVRLADATVTTSDPARISERARSLPGRPIVERRRQAEAPVSVRDHKLLGRLVGIPTGHQPDLNRLVLVDGALPAHPREVVAEQHLASHFDLRPGAQLAVWTHGAWRSVTVAGIAVSGEYLWPARSNQEILTSPEHFGVLFAPEPLVLAADPEAAAQVAVRFGDRAAVASGVAQLTAQTSASGAVVVPSDEQPSVKALDDDVNAFASFAVLFPLLFLAGGALGGYIVLARLVRAQRAVIGTLLANGVPRRRVMGHYVGFGVVAGLAGSLVGAAGGVLLAGWVAGLYADAIGLPFRVARLHPLTPLVAIAAGLAAAVVAAAAPARAAAQLDPAEAMSPSSGAGRGGRSLAERLVPPLRRLPARWLMVLRGVGRNRRRTLLTAAGVVTALCLILTAAGLRDTVSAVLDEQFSTVQREDAQVMLAAPAGADTLARVHAVPGVAAAERFARLDASVTTVRGQRHHTLLFVLEPHTAMHEFRSSGGTADPLHGLVVGDGLRTTLRLAVGDRLTVTGVGVGGAHVTLTDRIAGFVDEPMSPVVYASTERLARAEGTDALNGVLVRLTSGADRAAVTRAITELPGVTAYLDTRSLETEMRKAFSLYNTIVGLMLVFGAVLAGALLYNAMTANAAERTSELGALQAAGMDRRTIGRLVGAENLLLASAGIIPGLLAGHQLARAFMSTYETEGYSWPLHMRGSTLAAAAAAVLLTTIAAQWPALRALRRLDLARVVRERAL